MTKKMCAASYRLKRDFLWEGHSDKKKMHMKKRSDVIKPKTCGLGLGDLRKG